MKNLGGAHIIHTISMNDIDIIPTTNFFNTLIHNHINKYIHTQN